MTTTEPPNTSTPGTETYAPGGDSSHRWIWIVQILLVAGAVGLWFVGDQPLKTPTREALPVMGTLPEFTLATAGGDTVTLDTLHNTVWIADFIFTRCGGQCLDMTSRMAELRDALESDPHVRLVSVSVNPSYDTPDVLTEYAQRHDAVSKKWLFLTGPRETVSRLANDGFKLGVVEATEEQRAEGADLFLHSVKFVLVDGEGRIRGYYDAMESEDLHRLLADARTLAREIAG